MKSKRSTAYNQRKEKTERNAEICRLRDEEGLTFEQIGARYDISMQAAAKIYHRDCETYALNRMLSELHEIYAADEVLRDLRDLRKKPGMPK